MPKKDLYKRWILITGSTDGIGRQLASDLCANSRENFVIVHGRTVRNCEQTVASLLAENNGATNVDFVAADFAKMAEVTRMAEEIRMRFPSINSFISCASVVVQRRMKSQNGLELTLQINHLAHVVLWNELLPLLEQNAPSRILTVGSMLHNFSSIDWTDLNCERSTYDKFAQYSRTKLMNHLATLYIHRLMFKHKKEFQVTANVVDAEQRVEKKLATVALSRIPDANCYGSRAAPLSLHPSRTPTSIIAHHHYPEQNSHFSGTATMLSASESNLYEHTNAVDTLVRLTEGHEFSGVSGKYFDANGKELRLGADVCDVRVQDQLWAESNLLCNGVLGRRTKTAINNGNSAAFRNTGPQYTYSNSH